MNRTPLPTLTTLAVAAGASLLFWGVLAGPAVAMPYHADVFELMAKNGSGFSPAGSDLPGTAAYRVNLWNGTGCIGNLGIDTGSLAELKQGRMNPREGNETLEKANETETEEEEPEVDYTDANFMAAGISSDSGGPSIAVFRPVDDLLYEPPDAVDDTAYMRLVGLHIAGNDVSLAVRALD